MKPSKHGWTRHLILAALAALLTACGGGGGGSAPVPPPMATDTDGDGIPDTTDPDDDNDGVADVDDAFPLDAAETTDTDGDGTGDNADTDDDGDGTEDSSDAFPLDPNETADTDGDGTGDNADAFPNDAGETSDADNDGTGDNADTDDDNDGVEDAQDAFPLDASESVDTDGDGTGNNADTDDDGDGVDDAQDVFPLDATETEDADGDGVGNNADTDDDNDGTLDVNDDFPFNAARTQPIQPLYPDVNGTIQLPQTPAATQLTWILEQLTLSDTSLADINARFSPAALGSIPATDWRDFFQTLRTSFPSGTVQEVISMTPTQLSVLIGDAGDPANGGFLNLTTTYGTGLIDSFGVSAFPLNGSSTRTEDQALSYEQAADKLETLAEDVGVLVAQIDENNQCQPIFARNDETPLGTASIFKIWVTAALAQAIEEGVISADDTLALDSDKFVLGGSINNEPVGTLFTVLDYATLMLGISDNTATEHMFRLTGRARNEQALVDLNHQHLDAMQPFLSMSEAFHLYFTVSEADALNYIASSEADQRTYVDTVLEPLGPVTSFLNANLSALVRGLWQASPGDVCRAIAGMRQYNDRSDGFALIDQSYGSNSALLGVRNQWERVWFKGGSLADGVPGLRVLTYGWLVETDSRGAFAIVAMGNNDEIGNERIDQSLFTSVASRLVDIINETQ